MPIRSVLAAALLLVLAACAGNGPGQVIASGDRYAPVQATVVDYKLGVGDRLKVTVFNEPTLSGDFGVAADGAVALPLIGDVPANGRTVDAFVADARARYADGYLRQPRISAEVSVFRPLFILGEVSTPGGYPYAVGLTALNAVALAKGFTPRANHDVVRIRREGSQEEIAYRLTPELLVFPGDTIRVGERYF